MTKIGTFLLLTLYQASEMQTLLTSIVYMFHLLFSLKTFTAAAEYTTVRQ
jgi:hypothetical protein